MDQNTDKTKTLVLAALISSLLSIGLHAYLTMNHFILKYGLSAEKSFCNINSQFNCDIVATSKYSTFFGLPIALWGASTHLILSLFLILVVMGLLSNKNRVLRISSLFSSFILGMSVVMGGISMYLMNTYCVFCILTYVLSAIIWFTLYRATRNSISTHLKEDLSSLFGDHKWIAIMFVAIPALGFLSRSIILDSYGLDKLEGMITESLESWKSSPDKNFDFNTGLLYQKSNESTKMIIVEFADYLCPHCKAAAKPLHDYAASHPGVKLIFKPFPLDGTCNENGVPKHDGIRCSLTYASLCAEETSKKGWETHEYIFDRQGNWNAAFLDHDLKDLTTSLGLDYVALKECMNRSETHAKVLALAKEGAGIEGTPTVYVNGKLLPRGQFPPVLEGAGKALGL